MKDIFDVNEVKFATIEANVHYIGLLYRYML
ncbi:hypothetical protein [Sedimentibacter sp. zth1]